MRINICMFVFISVLGGSDSAIRKICTATVVIRLNPLSHMWPYQDFGKTFSWSVRVYLPYTYHRVYIKPCHCKKFITVFAASQFPKSHIRNSYFKAKAFNSQVFELRVRQSRCAFHQSRSVVPYALPHPLFGLSRLVTTTTINQRHESLQPPRTGILKRQRRRQGTMRRRQLDIEGPEC